jgi:hypothetical protein
MSDADRRITEGAAEARADEREKTIAECVRKLRTCPSSEWERADDWLEEEMNKS